MLNQFQLFYPFVIQTKEESQQTGATNEIDSPVRYCSSLSSLEWQVNNSLHTLRHSPACQQVGLLLIYLKMENDLRYIQDFLGHSSMKTTKIYNQ